MPRQRLELYPEALADLESLGIVGIAGGIAPEMNDFHVTLPRRPSARRIQHAVDHDLGEPRREWPRRIERPDVLERRHEGVLHEIFGVLHLTENSIGDGERTLRVTAGELR